MTLTTSISSKTPIKDDLKGLNIDQLRAQNNERIGDYHKKLSEWSRNVDKRYAWVILASLWLSFAATLGSYRIYGLVFARITEEQIFTREEASWPVSMVFSVENLLGPLVSIIAYHMSYRYSMLVGGIFISLGNGLAYWSNSLLLDILLIGCVQGIGYAFIFMPFMEVINSYFLKYRNIALGFSLCGGTMSVFILTPLFRWILNTFHWRAAYLTIGMLGCINILLVPLFKPNPKPNLPPTGATSTTTTAANAADKLTESHKGTVSMRALTYQSSMRRQTTISIRRNSRNQRHGSIISVNPFASTAGMERRISRAMMDSNLSDIQNQHHQQQHQVQQQSSEDNEEETKSLHELEVETAKSEFRMSTIWEILKTPGFHVIWYLELIYYWIFAVYCLVLVDFGVDRGCTPDEARDLMMCQSVGEMIGRLGLTVLVDMQFTSHRNMVTIDLILMTIILCTLPYLNGFLLIATFTIILNAFASLLYIMLNGMLVNVLGERKVTIGYGLASSVVGFFIIFRPHAVGFFRDHLGSYEWLMISMGLSCALGAVFCILEGLFARCCTKEDKEADHGNNNKNLSINENQA